MLNKTKHIKEILNFLNKKFKKELRDNYHRFYGVYNKNKQKWELSVTSYWIFQNKTVQNWVKVMKKKYNIEVDFVIIYPVTIEILLKDKQRYFVI